MAKMEEKENKTQKAEKTQDISIKIDETNFTKNPEFAKILGSIKVKL